jgi:hypothetical protein
MSGVLNVLSLITLQVTATTMGSVYTFPVATMTGKQLQHLRELHARMSVGTFTETDVSALLVLLREKSRGGPILELAHSIVHSERDSGLFFKRIKENLDVLNNLGKKAGVVRVPT